MCLRRIQGIPVKETDMDRMFDYFSHCLSQNFLERRTESLKNGSLSSILSPFRGFLAGKCVENSSLTNITFPERDILSSVVDGGKPLEWSVFMCAGIPTGQSPGNRMVLRDDTEGDTEEPCS